MGAVRGAVQCSAVRCDAVRCRAVRCGFTPIYLRFTQPGQKAAKKAIFAKNAKNAKKTEGRGPEFSKK